MVTRPICRPRPARLTGLAAWLLVLATLLLAACSTEATWMPWYLGWTRQVLACEAGLLDSRGDLDNGSFRSFRFPDGRVFHAALRSQGELAPVRVLLFDSAFALVWSFSSVRLDLASLAASYVDEQGRLHLRGNWSSGELLTPPATGSTGWTRADAGDAAAHNFTDQSVRRTGSTGGDTMEFRLDLSAWPAIRLDWLNLVHGADGSISSPAGYDPDTPAWQSVIPWTTGLAGHLTELYPSLSGTLDEPALAAELQAMASNGNGPTLHLLEVQASPQGSPGWDRPTVRVLAYLESQWGLTVQLPPSQLLELSFPRLFASDTDPQAVLAAQAGQVGLAVYSQASVFADASLSWYPAVAASDSWSLAGDGLCLARQVVRNNQTCRYLLRFDKDGDAGHEALLAIPAAQDSSSDPRQTLPLFTDASTDWLIWDSTGSDLYVNRPWWEAP